MDDIMVHFHSNENVHVDSGSMFDTMQTNLFLTHIPLSQSMFCV